MKPSISLLMKIGKYVTRVPDVSFVWILRVLYFLVKHSCLSVQTLGIELERVEHWSELHQGSCFHPMVRSLLISLHHVKNILFYLPIQKHITLGDMILSNSNTFSDWRRTCHVPIFRSFFFSIFELGGVKKHLMTGSEGNSEFCFPWGRSLSAYCVFFCFFFLRNWSPLRKWSQNETRSGTNKS